MKTEARKIVVTGRVQGVGYRPFVYVTAEALGITGTVLNGSGKVFIHAEGPRDQLDRLESALIESAPPLARPRLASSEAAEPTEAAAFEILVSDAAGEAEIHVPPDLFTCDDCLAELTGPDERRYGYPFINCTQCGPRYTIITAMPYDRPNTSMAGFPLCNDCRGEYESPRDRRFHAQPLACPVCGPHLQYRNVEGRSAGDACAAEDSLLHAVAALRAGRIIAIKGVGGYHLVCDAANDDAARRLRIRKRRPDKPLAVMFPLRGEDGLDLVREHLSLDVVTAAAIADPARPIVLARKADPFRLSAELAPRLNELGVFLPYSPLHHQLLATFGRPVVATSGNVSGEPVITDEPEAERRLSGIVDGFLHHDRPIVRPADDPVVRPMAGRARVIRLGRGLAPLERELPEPLARPVLATGGHMKVTVALAWDRRVVVSPHIGDLDSPRSNEIFSRVIKDLQNLYSVDCEVIACDLHPGYASTRWAERQGLPLIRVQHHAAHASALAAEHPGVGDWLVFTWDGVGYGSDGSLWGGEALCGRPGAWQRRASFRPFSLLGGDKAGREPWRSAAALLWAEGMDLGRHLSPLPAGHLNREPTSSGRPIGADPVKPVARKRRQRSPGGFAAGNEARAECRGAWPPTSDYFAGEALRLAHQAWKKGTNTFETSAAGRLFDAAAALVLGRHTASFEGQGPMELEHAAQDGCEALELPLAADADGVWRSDWAPLLPILIDTDREAGVRAGMFHETMARAVLDQALTIRSQAPFDAVGLSGGVFQNRRLTERVVALLGDAGIDVRLHAEIPANDGGLCVGQAIEALARQKENEHG